ncbi:MAG: Nuclease SbcCD subunit D [bacterium ADurb.Bin478]|nr:MAG: Nuclease SbcCD subunit D [bacterium ADurb.Bin478]
MRLVHFSDTHLGFSEYYRTDPQTGLNQREQDVYQAWEQAIALILSLQPDLVLHAGDLFHTPRPNNRAIRVALEGIQKVSSAGIPMVIVSGNHETPRIRSTGSIFESLALFPNVFPVYESRYECHIIQSVAVHCIPHCSLTEELEAAVCAVTRCEGAAHQVLLTHGAWSGGSYGMGEFNEQRLPDLDATAAGPFDYIALGHYHKPLAIREHIRYSGSTERTSLSQSEHPCGLLEVDLDSGKKNFFELAVRPMLRLPVLECRKLSAADIYEQADRLSRTCPDGAVVQLTLNEVNASVFLQLETARLDSLFEHALQLEKIIRPAEAEDAVHRVNERIESLPVEFGRYLEAVEEPHWDKQRLMQLGYRYLDI